MYGSNISHWAIYMEEKKLGWCLGELTDWGVGGKYYWGDGGLVRGLIADLQIRVKVALCQCEGRLTGEKTV